MVLIDVFALRYLSVLGGQSLNEHRVNERSIDL